MGKKLKQGPTHQDGVPLDYIVIVDSGSTGSRVYVYNWLNPEYVLKHGLKDNDKRQVNLVEVGERKDGKKDNMEDDEEDENDTDSDSDSESESDEILFPKLHSKKKWHRKVKPGLSSFKTMPHKVGKSHLNGLLSLASTVVPKSQHFRTPIFLHATAGMRLLTPTEQSDLLSTVCEYLSSNSDFFLPDCKSHINVIDGSVEGIYGWLSINYMKKALDLPSKHQHGKNHTTYGLLDMGGASTQVVFQPNLTEIEEHKNNLFELTLYQLPKEEKSTKGGLVRSIDDFSKENPSRSESDSTEESQYIPFYSPPAGVSVEIYSDSFLGFGMYQAHKRFLDYLVGENSHSRQVTDPCLPKGFTHKEEIQDSLVEFIGDSNFKDCLTNLFPVFSKSTYNSNADCKQLSNESEVASCLLNDLIPSFDFDVDHFIGVSGYWDSVQGLLSYSNDDKIKRKKKDQSNDYDYQFMYNATEKLCTKSFNSLLKLNERKSKNDRLKDDDLADLCFKSSWILNFLHIGLGFPRFGIDEAPIKSDDFVSLQFVEELNGNAFSWTLGRALLYANDEYVQAYNNLTTSTENLKRSGFSHSASKNDFRFGAEQSDIAQRPQFIEGRENATYPHYDYENLTDTIEQVLKWDLEPHRWIGFVIFFALIGFIVWLMVGTSKRSLFFTILKEKSLHAYDKVATKVGIKRRDRYVLIQNDNDQLEAGLELDNVRTSIDTFKIDSDED